MRLCRTLWLLILSQVCSVTGLAQAVPQPAAYELQPVFTDDFSNDTRGDYTVTGDIAWEAGQLTLQPDASIERSMKAGAWVKVDVALEMPELTAAHPESEVQIWFELDETTDCFVRLRRTLTEQGPTASVALFDTGEQDGKPVDVLVREATLDNDDVGRLTVGYRYGLVQVWAEEIAVLVAHIQNGSSAAAGLRVIGPRTGVRLNRISSSSIPAPAELTAEQQEQLAKAATANARLADLYAQGKFAEAASIGEVVLKIRKAVFGDDHPDTATSFNNLAMMYQAQGNHAAAEPLFLRAMEICETALGPDHPHTATSFDNLASLYRVQANYAAAEPLYKRALKICEKSLGRDHPDTAGSVNNLAVLYEAQANYAAAEPLFLRALKSHETAFGPNDPATAASLNNLAAVYDSQGNYAAAEPLYQRALKVRETVLGPDHPETATSLNNLAAVYESQANYAAAEPLYERALKIRDFALGPDHPDTAGSVNNLAAVYESQANYAAAEPLYLRALEISEKALGPDHPHTAKGLNNLAGLYNSHGNFAAAELRYQRALTINEKILGPDHPDTAQSLSNLALFDWSQDRAEAAVPHSAQSLQIMLRNLDATAAIQTEQQQFLMSRDVGRHMSSLLTVTGTDPQWTSMVYRDVLAWKGLITARQQGVRLSLKGDPLFAEFRRVTQQLSTVSLSPPLPPSDPQSIEPWKAREPELRRNWESQKATLEGEHERLEKELAVKSVAFRQSLEQRRVQPDDMVATLKALDRPTALVDVLEYGYYGRKDKGEKKERRIVAFVVRGDQPVARVELGSAGAIAEQVAQWREIILRKADGQQVGEELWKRVWLPLEPHLHGIETVLVSTDGVLGLLPFEALPGKADGTLLIEDYRLAYVPVPQLIPGMLAKPASSLANQRLLLVGDVDYGTDASGEHTPWKPLRGTAEELQALSALHLSVFPATDGFMALRGAAATEGQVAEQLAQFQVLHFATHGLFEQDEHRLIPSSQSLVGSRGAKVLSSTFDDSQQTVKVTRSGLVLAGANRQSEALPDGSEPEVTDDGLMMENEILAMSLENASLVVMSACDTAQGKQQGGEGLLGIQRAFQVAGARTTVASLWQVDDAATVLLMQRFYENLWSRKLSRLDALREAQLWMLRSGKLTLIEAARRTIARGQETRGAELVLDELEKLQDDRLPPYYWAAFALSGDWR